MHMCMWGVARIMRRMPLPACLKAMWPILQHRPAVCFWQCLSWLAQLGVLQTHF